MKGHRSLDCGLLRIYGKFKSTKMYRTGYCNINSSCFYTCIVYIVTNIKRGRMYVIII